VSPGRDGKPTLPACFLHTPDPRGTFEVSDAERDAFFEQLYAVPGFGTCRVPLGTGYDEVYNHEHVRLMDLPVCVGFLRMAGEAVAGCRRRLMVLLGGAAGVRLGWALFVLRRTSC
jgi:hypothetical protein